MNKTKQQMICRNKENKKGRMKMTKRWMMRWRRMKFKDSR
jgi:hypothetical protein